MSFITRYSLVLAFLRQVGGGGSASARKQYELLAADPTHPSVQLKPVGAFWSARVSDAYRALSLRQENTFVWFWVGTHDEYERLPKG